MTNLLKNIAEYYIDTIVEEHGLERSEATRLLEEALQDPDIENAIMERIQTL